MKQERADKRYFLCHPFFPEFSCSPLFCFYGRKLSGWCRPTVCRSRCWLTWLLHERQLSTSTADKKVADQNSLSESEQYPVTLGLVRLHAVRRKKCGSTASKADGAACCSFLVSLHLQLWIDLLAGWACSAPGGGSRADRSLKCCGSDLLLRAALRHQTAFNPLHFKSFTWGAQVRNCCCKSLCRRTFTFSTDLQALSLGA